MTGNNDVIQCWIVPDWSQTLSMVSSRTRQVMSISQRTCASEHDRADHVFTMTSSPPTTPSSGARPRDTAADSNKAAAKSANGSDRKCAALHRCDVMVVSALDFRFVQNTADDVVSACASVCKLFATCNHGFRSEFSTT